MRVIAAITVFFLPATFTATFFSTTFFSFNENLDGKVYSGWLWLYFVVTVVLTAVVVVGTWILWKVKEREILERAARQVGSEKQLCVDMPVAQQPPVLVAAMQNYMQQEIGARTTAKANGGS
jgi:heme exporter protein D